LPSIYKIANQSSWFKRTAPTYDSHSADNGSGIAFDTGWLDSPPGANSLNHMRFKDVPVLLS
tara:strand:+ start:299 stop:484 length:186 start_codon:yes stop_codon:yes gene_type:complete